MLRFFQVGIWCILTLLVSVVCCFEFGSLQFWMLEPGNEGVIGMGIGALMLFFPTALILVPASFFWLKQQIDAGDKSTWWRRSVGLVLSAGIALLGLRWLQVVPIIGIRLVGWILSWGLILFELLPLRKKLWGVL